MDNLTIYEKGRQVPKEAQKSFNNGSFSGTDINPMWRIKTLTSIFGPAGIGWYTEEKEKWTEEINGEIMVHMTILLYVKDPETNEWSKPIYGIGGNKSLQQFRSGPKATDEAYKMAYTDALSVACKALGIGADIYFDKDVTKYTANQESPAPAPKPQDDLKKALQDADKSKTLDELMAVWNKYKSLQKEKTFVAKLSEVKARLTQK